ncbi:MAG: D-Ala-D-Ala carboxypeptidase family metallohydrolase [Melioribacteraceae bacterium]
MINEQLSENFFLKEFIYSYTAERLNIPNIPNQDQIFNLKMLCKHILQPLREYVKYPIIITSGFRSYDLNKEVKGSRNSAHLKGCATDIISIKYSSKEIFDMIRILKLPYDELILEFNSWVHVSYNNRKRNITLIAEKNEVGQTQFRKV